MWCLYLLKNTTLYVVFMKGIGTLKNCSVLFFDYTKNMFNIKFYDK